MKKNTREERERERETQYSLFSLFFFENGGFQRPKRRHGWHNNKQGEANQSKVLYFVLPFNWEHKQKQRSNWVRHFFCPWHKQRQYDFMSLIQVKCFFFLNFYFF